MERQLLNTDGTVLDSQWCWIDGWWLNIGLKGISTVYCLLVNGGCGGEWMDAFCCCSVIQSRPTLRSHGLQHARLPFPSPYPRSLFKLMSIESVMPSNHLILCCLLLLLPSIFPSIRVFPNESVLHIRWPKYWSFSFSISPSSKIQDWSPLGWTGWISLQSKGLPRVFSNTTVQKHQFFGTQPFLWSNSHIHTWLLEKIIALTIQIFVSKVMSLLFNMLSRLVIVFLPRSKRPLISWLQLPSAVILEPKKVKSVTVSIVSTSICHEVMGPDPWSWFSECRVLFFIFIFLIFFECRVLNQFFHSLSPS